MYTRRDALRLGAMSVFGSGVLLAGERDDAPPDRLIGYTEYRTDLPGGRHINVKTMRAAIIKADGTGRRVLAEELTEEKGSWTSFTGWSPDGKLAILSRNWQSEESGKWEEDHKDFRRTGDGFT
jgi:TolB protein